ncbi:hypothetical protein HELRODRAFT_178227 [Helobdella robusta]|uniref:Uncharacterized protein n=1 Tax=Helobdella robusta TaxID=6412 RepID=T1FCY8_HELRO|nr:hypothetical protein HELRODRAFT_178227 [Helobdella robusta]ESN97432.1 hypothetical protein HELRODRAFT_178227 [Helobdella robusta]
MAGMSQQRESWQYLLEFNCIFRSTSSEYLNCKYFCNLCNYHCKDVEHSIRHLERDDKHLKLMELKKIALDFKFGPTSNNPTPRHPDQLDKFLSNLYHAVSLSPEDYETRETSTKAVAKMYGSTRTKCALLTSDLNINVRTDRPVEVLKLLHKMMVEDENGLLIGWVA